LASSVRGAMFGDFSLGPILAFDPSNMILDLETFSTVSLNGQTMTFVGESVLKNEGGRWLMYGDQRPAQMGIQIETRTDSSSSGNNTYPDVNVDIRPPKGAVSAVTVSGGPFVAAPVPKSNQIIHTTLQPAPGTTIDFVQDAFFTGHMGAPLPPAGTAFTVTVTPTSGTPTQSIVVVNGSGGEPLILTSPAPDGSHALAAANLGQPLTVAWKLPTTYAVSSIQVGGFYSDGINQQEIDSPPLPVTATSTTLTIPPTLSTTGTATTQVTLNITIEGPNGERGTLIYLYQ
jgi:hypothetical protein